MKKIRFAILGCGGMATTHARALNDNPEAELVALCDLSTEPCQTLLERLKSQTSVESDPLIFTDAASLYAECDLDAVVIVTPHTLHYEHGRQALEAGVNVMLEKPMVTDSKQAYALAELSKTTGKRVVVGFNTSFTPNFRWLREHIRSERFGRLELVNGYLSQNWLKATSGTWRQQPELSGGGQAYDSGAHLLNSLVWSVESAPAQVHALADFHGTKVDINSVINIRFENGVLASICVGGNCISDGSHMVFLFEKGRVEIDGWCGGWLKAWDENGPIEAELTTEYRHPTANLIDVLAGRDEQLTSPLNGIHHSELMNAIYASIDSEQAIRKEVKAS